MIAEALRPNNSLIVYNFNKYKSSLVQYHPFEAKCHIYSELDKYQALILLLNFYFNYPYVIFFVSLQLV
jgi:hypothetical protein